MSGIVSLIERVQSVGLYWIRLFRESFKDTVGLLWSQRLQSLIITAIIFFLTFFVHNLLWGPEEMEQQVKPALSGVIAVCVVGFVIFVFMLLSAPYSEYKKQKARVDELETQLTTRQKVSADKAAGKKIKPAGPMRTDWRSLENNLRKSRRVHSRAFLLFVSTKRPLFEKLKSTFDLAGWVTDCCPSAWDQYPQGGAFNYYKGTEVKGVNRVFVESIADHLSSAGLTGVFATVAEPEIGPDHPKWERTQQEVRILVGHDD